MNGQDYVFDKNLQGDIIRIYDENFSSVVKYTYDAWGKILSIDGTGASTIGEYNSLRYRGYYYDSDTGLYYHNSRYYDPVMCRFVNADGYASTGQGITGNNMYAYCGNNPINMIDTEGTCHGYANNPNLDSPASGVRWGYNCGSYGIHVRHPITSPVDHSDYRNDAPSAAYGSKRKNGRTHKGVDYYPSDSKNNSKYGSDGSAKHVYAMLSGTVIDYIPNFYAGTSALVIDHGKFIALYGEISTDYRVGDKVLHGQDLGTMAISWDNTLMLHLEIFKGGYGAYSRENPYRIDPTYTYSLHDR